MHYSTVKDISIDKQRVVIRVDFNVPLTKAGVIVDDVRIRASLPTIQYCLEHGATVVLMSHLGRPKGKRKEAFSLRPCAVRLSELLHQEVQFVHDVMEEVPDKLSQIVLLENLRFYEGEEHPEEHPEFVRALKRWGDIYVNDAFATAHRKHASTYYLPALMQHAVVGFLVEKEVNILHKFMQEVSHPFYAVIGGNKVSSKIGLLQALISKVDKLFVGGGMAFTFLYALDQPIGKSLLDEKDVPLAKEILAHAKEKGCTIFLPEDVVTTVEIKEGVGHQVRKIADIQANEYGVDIGPETVATWKTEMADAKKIFWNGPVGIYEMKDYSKGTLAVARILADATGQTIVGGGDSAAAIQDLKLENKITHICTGGGASLEFLETGDLVALDVVEKS